MRAKIGDRVRSKTYPGVSGIVKSVSTERASGRVVYKTMKGFWYHSDVTIEPKQPQPGGASE